MDAAEIVREFFIANIQPHICTSDIVVENAQYERYEQMFKKYLELGMQDSKNIENILNERKASILSYVLKGL